MILDTKSFFGLLRIHHRLSPTARRDDLSGRLKLIADGRINSDPLTRRCLALFLRRRS
ncbi:MULTISPECIES: hypothetical protein [Methylobacterium]|jgi:hypothetical protein|uniref:Uncharacterized protein n=1 Tax=Methylobacterium jeotgali TaxID=381630 RepID=A0ABQ4SYT1_9HYPH|nr:MULTISPECIES: hypothetical protein [Methylobacterium]GBU16824.1 hypothetical protein AwMethylo_10390 [Methylobacterium sp.]GJE08369.1 hypothetical protein AOPFMNJM_3706 [Methylobacterium jeotgali]